MLLYRLAFSFIMNENPTNKSNVSGSDISNTRALTLRLPFGSCNVNSVTPSVFVADPSANVTLCRAVVSISAPTRSTNAGCTRIQLLRISDVKPLSIINVAFDANVDCVAYTGSSISGPAWYLDSPSGCSGALMVGNCFLTVAPPEPAGTRRTVVVRRCRSWFSQTVR